MKIGVIDIGSNTVRLVVYRFNQKNIENIEDVEKILNESHFVGLVEYIDGNVLTYNGVMKLIEALTAHKELINEIQCDEVYCFATASLRNLKNANDIIFKVKSELDFDVDIISGEQEVHYDYIGVSDCIKEKRGVGLDLGGGSCQIFSFADDNIINSDSFNIGSLVTYKNYVDGLLPTKKEIKKIKKFVKKNLLNNKALKGIGYEKVYAIGGSARAGAKLHKAFVGNDGNASDYILTVEQIDEMIKTIYKMDIKGISFICHVIPERVYTIIPGLIILRTICKYIGAEKIQTVKGSVREGYLWEKILKKNCSSIEN